jgi:hypothetical protein
MLDKVHELRNPTCNRLLSSTAAYPALSTISAPATGTSADARVLTYKGVTSAGLPTKAAVPVDSDGFVPVSHKKKPLW